MTIWGCCYCIKVNICCKFCICSCYCLVCCRMTCIKSWCCFLDCSSFLLSASSRRFCSCISSISHFCMRSFFSRKYATVSLPPLRRLESTQEASVAFSCASRNSFASLVLSKLLREYLSRHKHAKQNQFFVVARRAIQHLKSLKLA